jgi:uncharacterized protein YceH (UPF0502 family)
MNEHSEEIASEPAALTLLLSPIEARIVGSLIEKQATTPDTYPLTLNAVAAACNQKTNREPTTDYEVGEIGHALRQLEGKGLVQGSLSARASRYAHRLDSAYNVTARQRALIGLLLLRGPQTLNELYVRSERVADFPDSEEVRTVLERLASRSPALVTRLGRGAGQREDRYMHLLSGPVSAEILTQANDTQTHVESRTNLAERVGRLEALVEKLQATVDELRAKIGNRDVP